MERNDIISDTITQHVHESEDYDEFWLLSNARPWSLNKIHLIY